jgi:hypothetical protein
MRTGLLTEGVRRAAVHVVNRSMAQFSDGRIAQGADVSRIT